MFKPKTNGQRSPKQKLLQTITLASIGALVGFSLMTMRPGKVQSAPSTNLNFQARIMNGSGSIVPDGNYHIQFKIYNDDTAGSLLWTETYTTGTSLVQVKNGYLSVKLGTHDNLADESDINWNEKHWLTMNVGGTGGSPSWDGEMSPRMQLTAVPFAFQAEKLATTELDDDRGTLGFDTLTDNRNILLPDEGGTLCIRNSSACGFLQGTGTAFVQGGNNLGGTTAGVLGTTNNGDLNVITNNTTRMTIQADGDVSFDGGLLFVDAVNDRVGIGDTTPSAYFSVGATSQFQIDASGNVLTSGTAAIQGASLTVGSSGLGGSLVLHDGNGETATISVGSGLTASTALHIPVGVGTDDNICLENLGNCTGGAGGAPDSAEYLTLSSNSTLSGERVLTAGTNIAFTDAGANLTLTVGTVNNPNFSTSVTTPLLTSSGTLTVTPGGAMTLGATTQTATLQGSTTSITSTGNTTLTSGGQITLDATSTIELQDNTNITGNLLNTGNVTLGDAAADAVAVNGTTTFNENVTIAAQKTIRFVGGTTAQRPVGPSEGQIYFDTETDKLLVYSNGKWQADRTIATKIVAASNSSQLVKDAADYVADGTGDHVEINAALTAAAGGTVYLAEGTYVAGATITIPNNTTLMGAGRGTLIELADLDATDNLIENSDTTTGTGVTIKDLRLDGRDDLNTAGTQNGISLTAMGNGGGSSARQGAKVTNVIANNFRSNGFRLDNTDNSTLTGNTSQGNDSGYLIETGSINNTFAGNLAQGNAQSGFLLLTASTGNTFTGNTSEGQANGFRLNTANNNAFTGNSVNNNTSMGFALESTSTNNTITGNTITSSGADGINLNASPRTNVTGNTISSNANNAIELISSSDSIISNNIMHDNGGSGSVSTIFLNSSGASSNVQIMGNRITDTAGTSNAIDIAAGTANYLSNNVYSGTGATSISDAGTNTIWAGQLNTDGDITLNPVTGDEIELIGNTNVTGALLVTATISAGTSVATPILTSTSALALTSASNGNISITPNGTGDIVMNVDSDSVFDLRNGGNTVVTFDGSGTLELIANGFDLTAVSQGIINVDSTITKSGTESFYGANFHPTINVNADPTPFGGDYLFRDWASRNINATSGTLSDNGGHTSFGANPGITGTGNNNSTLVALLGLHSHFTLTKTGTGTLTVSEAIGAFSGGDINANTVITDRYGFKVEDIEGAGAITNQYGLHISNLNQATNNYGIYVENAEDYAIWIDDGASRFDGTLQVGTLGTTDTNAVLCRNSSNQLAACTSTFATTANAFMQGGNDFGGTTAGTLGTINNGSLNFITNNVTRLTIDTSGNANLTGDLTVTGGDIQSTAGLTVTGGTTQGNTLTLRGSDQAWSSTTPNQVEVLNSSLAFNGQTSVGQNKFPSLISFNDTVSLTGASVWSLTGFDYSPTFQQDTTFNFGSAPAFSARPIFQPTVGGINDSVNFILSGYASTVTHSLNHSGGAGTTAIMTGYYDNPFFSRAGGTGTHTITDYAGYMTWTPRVFDNHIQDGYTVTTGRSFWARNPEISGTGSIVNNIGLDVEALSGGTSSNVGVRIAAPTGTGAAALALTGTTGLSSTGILFGNDTTLYRSAAASLSTNATTLTGTTSLAVRSTTTNSVTLDSGTTGDVNVGTSANAKTVNIGTGAAVANTINIGGTGANVLGIANTQTAGSVSLGAAMTTGTIQIGGTGAQTGTISFGGGTGAQTVNVGTGNTGVKTVNIGTGTAANVISIGTGQAAGSIALGTAMTTGTISIGGTGAQTGTIGLGVGTGAQTINLGTGGTGAKTVTLGSTASTGATTIQAGTGGITLLGKTVARATTDGATTFDLQNSVGATLFSLDSTNTSTTLNVALNSGAETGCPASPTSWAAHSSTLTCESSVVASGTYSARAATTGATQGLRNNVGTAMSASTTYNVSFSIRTSVALANGSLVVALSPTGTASNNSTCTAGTNPTISTSTFTKFTCTMVANSTATNSSAYLAIYQSDGTSRNIYIDNLSIVQQNSAGTQNTAVIRVGGSTSQGLTLFTLDTSAGTPFTGSNSALAGSMYFDTTQNKIQCYDGSSWGACGAAPDNNVTLTPEYTGAVLNGTGIGTMTADFCGNDGVGSFSDVNTGFCASGEARNYYKWTSPQASAQTYSIYVTYKLPSTFENFISDSTVTLTARRTDTNASVAYEVYKSTGSAITQCGSTTTVTTSDDTWQTVALTGGGETSCAFAGNNYVIFKINVSANSSAEAFVENLNFSFSNL